MGVYCNTCGEFVGNLSMHFCNKGNTMTDRDEPKCDAGCNHFYGGEIKHESTCPFYPESLTEMRDKMEAELSTLHAENEALREALLDIVEIGNAASDSFFEKAPNTTRGAYPAARSIASAALSPKES